MTRIKTLLIFILVAVFLTSCLEEFNLPSYGTELVGTYKVEDDILTTVADDDSCKIVIDENLKGTAYTYMAGSYMTAFTFEVTDWGAIVLVKYPNDPTKTDSELSNYKPLEDCFYFGDLKLSKSIGD